MTIARVVRPLTWALAGTAIAFAAFALLGQPMLVGVPAVPAAGGASLIAVVVGWIRYGSDGRVFGPVRVEPLWLIGGGLVVLLMTSGGTSGGAWLMASLGAYPLLALALVSLIRARMPLRSADVLVDVGLAATASGLFMWLALAPLSHHGPHAALVARIAVASLDVGLLTLIGRLLLLPGEKLNAYRHLAVGGFCLFSAHLVLAISVVRGGHHSLHTIDALLVGTFGFFGLAALDPSVARLFEPLTADPPTFSPGHTTLVCGAMLAIPAVVAIDATYRLPVSSTVAFVASLSAPVLAAYVATLLWDRARTERQAQHDGLTGLPNRPLFLDRVSRAVAHAQRNATTVAVMFIDLDNFKAVNDTYGHPTGDGLLVEMAARMRGVLRNEDTVARLAGDEFAILLPYLTSFEGVVTVAEKVMAAIRRPVAVGGSETIMTPSIGISVFPQDGTEPDQLVSAADVAMYRAKEEGRNAYEIFSPELRTRARDRLATETGLYRAIENDELVLHYQPQVDIASGQIVGVEALVRWNHPERGLLPPSEFIPVAEQSGLIVALGEHVLRAACAQNHAWQEAGLPPVVMAVNVSARQFRQGIADVTAATLRQAELAPQWLQLELTESAAIDNLDLTLNSLTDVRDMGVGCAIDDFGTGYCGLKYLSELPISVLKIDRSFVQATSVRDAAIVTATINLGHGLGLRVVAEGVETEAQFHSLAAQHCDEVQGYLFSRPVPADAFAQLLMSGPVFPAAKARTSEPAVTPTPHPMPVVAAMR